MINKKKVIGIIPARGGSKRCIKKKATRLALTVATNIAKTILNDPKSM